MLGGLESDRVLLLPLLGAMIVGFLGPGAVAPAPARVAGTDALRAISSYAAMEKNFSAPKGLLWETHPRVRGQGYAKLWPYSQALAATLSVVKLRPRAGWPRRALRARLAALEWYWNPQIRPAAYDASVGPPLDGRRDQYYDDNEWVALDLVEVHRAIGDRGTLLRARRLFEFVERGWDREPRHPCPGGVFWTRAAGVNHRNTVSTANGAVLALALYEATGARHYLRWAQTMYEWVHRCMAAPNGLFWDHIDLKGRVDATHWSYNQGLVIAADTALYQITHDARFLRAAEAVADAALGWFEDSADSEPPEFMSVFYRSLLRLQAEDPGRDYFTAAQAYADAAWARYRVRKTALFSFGGRPDLLGQGAMVQLFADLATFGRD